MVLAEVNTSSRRWRAHLLCGCGGAWWCRGRSLSADQWYAELRAAPSEFTQLQDEIASVLVLVGPHGDRPALGASSPRAPRPLSASAARGTVSVADDEPWRFSIRAWLMTQSLASFPCSFRNSRASGLVVEACVSLRRRSPWRRASHCGHSRAALPAESSPGSPRVRPTTVDRETLAAQELPDPRMGENRCQELTLAWTSFSAAC
jgi:hypothetical protein